MSAKILDGTAVASQIKAEIKAEIASLDEKPCLGVILCSHDPASEIYVNHKRKACEEVGIRSILVRLFEGGIEHYSNPVKVLRRALESFNVDRKIHGILVQLPLPAPLDPFEVFDRIHPMKDVDVLSPENIGLLSQGRPRFVSCTPAGIQELLSRSGITIEGKRVTIINRSNIVGKPLQSLLVQDAENANATVTLCHDHTPPKLLKEACLSSDIIVVAVGKRNFLTADLVPKGAVVVDVGINRIPDSKKIVGDCDFDAVSKKAGYISPVPGGVGKMTIACLLRNTLKAYKLQCETVSGLNTYSYGPIKV